MMHNCLDVNDLTFAYNKEKLILNGVNLQFEAGKITALLGNNGCGKTTLLRILCGITCQNSGSIVYNGVEITKDNLLSYKRKLSYMPESLQLYPDMKVYEVLRFISALKNHPKSMLMETIEKVGLNEHYKKPVRALSKGLKQRLNLAQAILGNPKIIIFDEPSNGFDYSGVRSFYTILKRLAGDGAVVILTTHLLSELLDNVDNVAIMSQGEIVKSGPISELCITPHSGIENKRDTFMKILEEFLS